MGNPEGKSRIVCDLDFDKNGLQAGYARAPYSRNTSGWGVIEIPVFVVKNGNGPTVLLTGGVHGDEYEGQIAISRLARTIDPARVQGRVIMMPAVNGYQVCRELKENPETSSIPILMLTAKSQESDRFWGKEAGADAYMTKPFDMDELIAEMRALLNE